MDTSWWLYISNSSVLLYKTGKSDDIWNSDGNGVDNSYALRIKISKENSFMQLQLGETGENKMFEIKMKGLKQFEKRLKRLQENIYRIDGKVIRAKSLEEAKRKIREQIFK